MKFIYIVSFIIIGIVSSSELYSKEEVLKNEEIKENSSSPRQVIESITSNIRKLIQEKPGEGSKELRGMISSIVNKAFDFNSLSEKTIKKEFWAKLQNKQKATFKTLFSSLLKKLYSKKTEELIAKADLDFLKEAIKDNHATVDYSIKRKDVDIVITYEMCKAKLSKNQDNPWKICNVKFDGADLARTYAIQFNTKLEKGILQKVSLTKSFDSLLAQMDKKVNTI